MLPPKRSTRSLNATSLTNDEPVSPPINIVQEEIPCQPPSPWDSPTHFVVNTPQDVLASQGCQADSMQKKVRRRLTTPQRVALEDLASREINPSLEVRRALAAEIGL